MPPQRSFPISNSHFKHRGNRSSQERTATSKHSFDSVRDKTDTKELKQMHKQAWERRGEQISEKFQLNGSAFRKVDLLYQMLLLLRKFTSAYTLIALLVIKTSMYYYIVHC